MSNLTIQLKAILEDAIDHHVTPGAVVGCIENGQRTVVSAGRFRYDNDAPVVTQDTIYDVASITKSVATGLLALKAIEEHQINLETKLINVLPDFTGKYHDQITVRHLLTYTVIADLESSTAELSKQGGHHLVNQIKTSPLKYTPGTEFAYINTPIIMLTLLLEAVYNAAFYDLVKQKIFTPLQMNSTTFYPSQLEEYTVPPTESINGKDIHKIVHDESARAMQADGYQTGHAGMFSSANDLLNVCEMIIGCGKFNGSHFLQPEIIKDTHTNQLETIGHRNGLGWEMDESFFRGMYTNPDIIGKTGFTGCSVTINTKNKSALVLLSNAKYPDRSTTRGQLIQTRLKLLKACEIA